MLFKKYCDNGKKPTGDHKGRTLLYDVLCVI